MKNLMSQMSLVLALLIFSVSGFAQQSGFNEIFDSEGKVRPQYLEIHRLWTQRYSTQQNSFLKFSRKAFEGDNALDPMPRLIESSEYDVLKKGVEQRAQAILAFLKDHYSGKKSYAKAGVIPKEVVDRIIVRSGEAGYEGLLNPRSISFFYGPDIIKDPQGNWRVIEDNLGFIGGVGDLKLAQEMMLKSYPELKDYSPRKASDFYVKLAASYKARAKKFGGKAILYTMPDYASDNEDKRISEIFAEQGIETITPDSEKRIKFRPDGVYLEILNGKEVLSSEKVGFIFMNGEHAWMDPTHPASIQKNLLEDAATILKEKRLGAKFRTELAQVLNDVDPQTKLPNFKKLRKLVQVRGYGADAKIGRRNKGMVDAILAGKVGANYSPGVDFVGDKEFYVYVEKLVEFYLQQKPVIKNIDTKKLNLAEGNQTDEKLLESVFANLSEYVIKKVDGRGGDSVWVGPKIAASEIENLKRAIRENPDLYIVQKYTALSTMNDNIVDLRVITDVSPKGILVTDTPWGRGLPKDGNGKVNLSDQGREVGILVVQPYAQVRACYRVFAN